MSDDPYGGLFVAVLTFVAALVVLLGFLAWVVTVWL